MTLDPHYIITQNDKSTRVMLTPKEYDELVYRKTFLDSVSRGLADADNGRTFSTKELRVKMSSRKKGA